MTDQTQINQQLTEHAQKAASGQSASGQGASPSQGDSSQVNQALIKEIIPYIQLSSMPQRKSDVASVIAGHGREAPAQT